MRKTVEIFRVYSYKEVDIMIEMLRNLRFIDYGDLTLDSNGSIKAEGVYWISIFREHINKGYVSIQIATTRFKMWIAKIILWLRGFRFQSI